MLEGKFTGEIAGVVSRIEKESDVKRVIELVPVPDEPGRYRYLIETPFATYPTHAIGTTDAACEDVRIESLHGAEWGAQARWQEVQ